MHYRFALTVASVVLAAFGSFNMVAAKAAEYKTDGAAGRVEFKIDDAVFANAGRREVQLDMFFNFRRPDAGEVQFTRFAANFDREALFGNFARPIDRKADFTRFTADRDRKELFTKFARGIDRQVRFTAFAGGIDRQVRFTAFARSVDQEGPLTTFVGNFWEAPVRRLQSYNRTPTRFGLQST